MSNRRSNVITTRVSHTNSIPNKTNANTNNKSTQRIQITNVVPPRKAKKEQQIKNINQNMKVDYNSNNYFYSNENDNEEGERYIECFEQNPKDQKYNRETSDSYITVEQEDGNFKNVPKYYVDYSNRRNSPYNNNEKYQYYEENSGDYENEEENEEMFYENDEEYEQDEEEEQQHPKNNYKKYDKYYASKNNKDKKSNKVIQKVNQNVISRPIHHQIDYTKDIKRKSRMTGRMNNYGNNSTTTNNTYNNNIYYINPINVKNKNSKDESQNNKKTNNKKNTVYKNVDITINKRKSNKEKDYFKLHNIDKTERAEYIRHAIKIQSIFRSYLLKLKLSNSINLYISLKKGILIIEELILDRKRFFWKKYKKYLSKIDQAFLNLNLIQQYLRNNRNNSTDKKIVSFHKELGDSFNIINKKDNSEIKLKSKLNDVIKENTELKNQLVDNKNIEEKIKNLLDENKKNQNINAIIMKDNQQLAKKLKDFQDYRNTNLIVENQSSLDLTQKELIEIDELFKKNELYRTKIKENFLANVINKKIEKDKYLKKVLFGRFKNGVEIKKLEEKENNFKKNIYLMNLVYIIENSIKLTKLKCYKDIFYASVLSFQEKKSQEKLKNEIIKNIFIIIDKKSKNILLRAFIKLYYNNYAQVKQKPEEKDENVKSKLLNKIFNNYDSNRRSILKVLMEKWSLKSKILGIRAAARDKKKKRKLKKKKNKLITQTNFSLIEKNKENKNNLTNQLCKSIHEFSYIVSNGTIIKESSSNEPAEINIKNNKYSISSDKINKKFNKNVGLKKINSVNVIKTQNNIKKEPKEYIKEKENSNNEESDEDSGDSLGLGNNSD